MKDVTIPLKLISLLADGEFHSGEQFGAALRINRAAINKHIQMVRNWGVDVFTVPGKGYRLYAPLQLLDESVIRARLPAGRLAVLAVIDSTNQYLIERIGTVQPGDACVAEYQAQGRGRRGRQWISPFGNNLYLSLYWRLEQGPPAADGLSLMVGIVMAEVLQRLGAEGVRVKWPNDLYLNDRKLAGILVEISGKAGDAAHVVIGVGINLAMRENAVGKIDQGWINLQEAGIAIDRNALAAELTDTLRQALRQFERDGFAPFVARWQALDNFFDRPVKLLIGEREIKGVAREIDAQGALLLEQEGKLHAYLGGEISLRGQ
ncbi:MAG: bifunctional biotin--[acetyl-CoA-carboxylase] ligase/biotin operon repressor BirA [Sodalis sp. (in: enterobacteria)]|uniref:bifunctional biotin--[acetyl-CoA-carboxylase] ligase/biotin operon repressor BirA n=1 Tax=Sodalis sp. (in: enterobacteria) TaxID=1898979 RepID=UPI003F419964